MQPARRPSVAFNQSDEAFVSDSWRSLSVMMAKISKLPRLVRRFRETGGNVAVTTALALPVVLGAFGIGAEASSWMTGHRMLQNAADAAAIAAATEANSDYDDEARAVVAQYGLQNGVNGVTVSVSDSATCPSGVTGPCYSVTVSKPEPLLLARITGYQGDTTYGGSPAKLISATAIAVQGLAPRSYCVLTLGTSGVSPALRGNGVPNSALAGCNVMSNTAAECNGHNLGADVGDAHGINDGCGIARHSNVSVMPDPYASLASNIPSDPCPGINPGNPYPSTPKNNNDPALPPQNTPSGNMTSWSGSKPLCGDIQLAGDVAINQDTTLFIYNGDLDLNGHAIIAAPGVGVTIVFAGDNAHSHVPTKNGTLDFAAPTTGPWKGIALYQAPNLTSGVDISAAGNSPTWNITGMGYFPHASVTLSGAVNKSAFGKSCFGIVVDNLLINGTGSILEHGDCENAGLVLPNAMRPSRGKLVS
jgi:hypothetical protein